VRGFVPNTGYTLYHGTTRRAAESIKRIGLVAEVGDFTADAYGEYVEAYAEVGEELPAFVFASDKGGIKTAVTAMRAHIAMDLSVDYFDVGMDDLEAYGALIIIRDVEAGDYGWSDWQKAEEDAEDLPPTVEPGDWYFSGDVHPDEIITGSKMLTVLRRLRGLGQMKKT
jgi:hypothetical protein